MLQACEAAHIPAPEFEAEPTGFGVTCHFGEAVTQQLADDKSGESSEKTSEKTSEKIFGYLQENPQMTIAELSSEIGVTTRTIERNLEQLRIKNRIKRVGPDKGGHWEVLK